MVVARVGSGRSALRSLPLIGVTNFKKKLPTKHSQVRRNLFGTGKDPAENIRVATNILQSNVVNFKSRWNFDPIAEKPLTSGRYEWTPLEAKKSPEMEHKTLTPLIQKISLEQPQNVLQQQNSNQKIKEEVATDEPKTGLENKNKFSQPQECKNLRQTKITEFARVMKKRRKDLRKL
ncbi:UNVERIFIED_CONTAM: hypothetical protein RMT77_013128 [Armadillidium vulgare]